VADEVLTPEQQAAVETLDRDVLVTAGAGTGKTRVLTHRFTHIVEQGRAAVDEILALTFTEKAAREMKERIVRRFADRGRADDRRRVETAYIGTIHSFCARVLRENALEAGVDPHFTQLQEAAAAMLQRQVFDALMPGAGSSAGPAEVLLSEFSLPELREIVLSLYAHARRLGKRPAELVTAAAPDLGALADQARAAVAAALALAQAPASKALRNALAAARETGDRVATLLEAREFDWGAYDELQQAARLFKGNVGAREQKPIIADAKQGVLAFAGGLLGIGASARAQALRELLGEFDAAYRAAKDEQGLLDFDDLLTAARDLFGTPEQPTPTALGYRDRFRFFLMDEFQDTNRLQMAVVAPIIRPGRSFTVGDAKQSIYRFLYADVDIFREREPALAERGGANLALARNFRSHPAVLAFTNAFFGELWAQQGLTAGGLAPGRQFGERAGPRVEALLVEQGRNLREARAREADALARRIGELVGLGNSPALTLTGAERVRPATPGDVLVLFRATTEIQRYEDALSRYDLPYYTVSGRGFYHTQEVQDLRNLLAAIENPLDDVALAAVLRSPLVGVGDAGLYWLGAPAPSGPRDEDEPPPQGAGRIAAGLERAEQLGGLAPPDRERAAAFRPLFHRLRQLAAGSHVAEVLETAVRATDYDLKLLCQRNGRRRYANLEKLRQLALAFQSQARFGPRDFLDHLQHLQVLAERETEAATEAEDSDVVRLMTIHQAKGLEAPIVVVADLGRRLRFDPKPALLSSRGELALRLKHPLRDETAKPPDYEELEQAAIAADRAEDTRLFYVACTRAQEHLLLSGCVEADATLRSSEASSLRSTSADEPGRVKAPSLDRPYAGLRSWAQWVMQFLGLDELPPPQGRVMQAGEVPVLVRSDAPRPVGAERRTDRPLAVRFRAQLEAGEELEIAALDRQAEVEGLVREAQAVAARVTARPAPPAAQVTISATAALRYAACPRRYELADIARLPEPGFAHGEQERTAADRGDEDPSTRGERLHELLSKLDLQADFEQELTRLLADLPADARADAEAVLRRFRRGPLWDDLAAAQREAGALQRETPFVLRLDGGLLRGKADVLRRRAGGWMVVDYKTGARHDQEYRGQVVLYALACRELLGVAPTRGMIYYLDADAGEPETFAITGEMLDHAAAALQRALAGIAGGDFPRREGQACGRCGFLRVCAKASG